MSSKRWLYPGDGKPFSRAVAYFELVRDAGSRLRGLLSVMGPYESRGHGMARDTGMTIAKVVRSVKNSKQHPHQGKREIARRAARMGVA